ncbi:MAG: ATP-binding protein [Candidatus Korobacteraceae bacterium]
MPAEPKTRRELRHRRNTLILLGAGIVILFAVVFLQVSFNLTFLRPETFGQTLLFAALSALTFLGWLALTFILLRTVIKLYLERRTGVFGSKFRSKMVAGALVLSFGPVIALFLFSYGLMNRQIDKWFSRPLEEVRGSTTEVAQLLTSYAGQNASAEAEGIANAPDTQRAFRSGRFAPLLEELRRHEPTLQGGFVIALLDGQPEASFQAPELWPILSRKIPLSIPEGQSRTFQLGDQEYVAGSAAVGERGRILVAMPLPAKYSEVLKDLAASQQNYAAQRKEQRLVRRTYLQLLLLITLLVLFASTWFALSLSKAVTRPVLALAQGTNEISGGRLDYRVEVAAGDELADLVNSFNRMASELETGRQQIETSRKDLASAYATLEAREKHLQTVMQSIPTAVLSLDASEKVAHLNDALLRLFRPALAENGGPEKLDLGDLFPSEFTQELRRLIRRADRMGSTTEQMEVTVASASLVLAVTVASMNPRRVDPIPPRQRLGYVVVFEDLSGLLQAQRQAAWREVARRIAHEIKNPLTPIALSAERIRRHLSRGQDEASRAIIAGCAETITASVETVRRLVDEFSSLARFPAPQLRPSDLNATVTEALKLFEGRLEGINVSTFLAKDLPPVMADGEAMKRVIANLVDNAAEAMNGSPVRDLLISTALLGGRDTVELAVADTGHGVTPELKEKLFLPYFSTKQRGTGLGLAIVARIVEDHHGTIRVEENRPMGVRFIIELPVAAGTVRGESGDAAVHSTPATADTAVAGDPGAGEALS